MSRSFGSVVFAGIFCVALVAAGLLTTVSAQTPSSPVFSAVADVPNTPGIINPGTARIVQGWNGQIYSGDGNWGDGVLFSVTTGGVFSTVYPVNGYDGSFAALGSDGNIYGGDWNGGTGCGQLFQITPAGVENVIHTFSNTDGCFPNSAMVQAPNGTFYGTTANSSNGGYGVVYSITPSGTFNVVRAFSGSNGTVPTGVAFGSDGNLYGGTHQGGTNNAGVLYRLTPAGAYTVLYNLCSLTNCGDGSDVAIPLTPASDGNLYGFAFRGGPNNHGAIFKLTIGGKFTVINSVPTVSTAPATGMVQGTDGKLYSVHAQGSAGDNGAIFSLTTTGTATVLYQFCQQTNCADGQNPVSLVQDTDGKFYGLTTRGGGTQCGGGCGVFFSLDVGLKSFLTLSSTSGKVGSQVGILGNGFTSSSVVKFNGVTAAYTLGDVGFITATVPAGASSGYVTVTTGSTTLTSSAKYVVHNSWSQGKVMPVAAEGAAAGYISGKIYVVGGGDGTTTFGNNQIYNTLTNVWTTGAAIPTPVSAAASAVVAGNLYVFGGYEGNGTDSNLVQIYNPKTNTWTTGSAMPTARGSATAVVDGTSIYVIGGNGPTLRLTTVEKYVPSTNTWTEEAPLLVGKSEPAAGLLGTTIVAADGYTSSSDNGDNEGYNVSKNTWSGLAADPTARNATCFGAISGLLYVAGGGDNGSPQSLNESYSATSKKWTTLLAMPQSTIFPAATAANGLLYCFGGSNVDHGTGTIYNNVQIYQP